MRGSDYAELAAFVAVVDQGSFARAAQYLRMAPSSLSHTIKKLEQRLGVELLHRTTRNMSMTSAGSMLYHRFKPAMAEMRAAIADLNEAGASPAGLVRMHIPRAAYALLVEGRLGELSRRYPGIHLDIVIDDALINVAQAGFDLDVRLSSMLDASVTALTTGGPVRHVAVASPAYLAEYGTPTTPSDLTAHRCIQWRRPGTSTPYRWVFQVHDCTATIDTAGAFTVSHCDLAVAAAADGVGVAFVLEPHAQPFLATGAIIPILSSFLPSFSGWSICRPSPSRPTLAAQAVADHFADDEAGTIEIASQPLVDTSQN